jgi:hypothetical protein
MSDPLDTVRDLAPPVGAQPELLERVRKDLMATITQPPQSDAASTPRRTRRRWAIPIAAAAVLLVAAAGWAILDSSDSTGLQCPGNAFIDAKTGDPVLDCSNEWRHYNETEPPPMVAYDNGRGGVAVLLESDAVPDGYTALDPGPFQDAALIELEAALGDVGTGLESECYDDVEATRITRRELDRLGLAHWTVTVDDDRRPDGTTTCATFIPDAQLQQVQLIGLPGVNAPDPFTDYAAALNEELSASCVGLDEAADLARTLAASTEIVVNGTRIDFTEEASVLFIHIVEDPDAACTRANVNVGGRVEVTLRGPTQ